MIYFSGLRYPLIRNSGCTYSIMGVGPSFSPSFFIGLTPFLFDDVQQLIFHRSLDLKTVDKRQHAGNGLQQEYHDHQNEILHTIQQSLLTELHAAIRVGLIYIADIHH